MDEINSEVLNESTEMKCSKEAMVKAFNEWMRRYHEEPEKFQAEFRTIIRFLEEDKDGKEPSYGEICTAYMEELMKEKAGPVGDSIVAP